MSPCSQLYSGGGLSASAQVTIRADVEWRAPEAWPTEVTPPEASSDVWRVATSADSANVLPDPFSYGAIRGYRVSFPFTYGPTPRLTSANQGQGISGTAEVVDGQANVLGARSIGSAFAQTGSESIGVFNGSTCGDDDWFYTSFEPVSSLLILRYPDERGLAVRLTLDEAHCDKPNSITNWCPCYLDSAPVVKWTEGFDLKTYPEPITPSDLHVAATPDSLAPEASSALTVRLIDTHGYEVHLDVAGGFTSATPVTLSALPAASGGLVYGGGTPASAVTAPYGEARAGAVSYLAGADTVRYDTPVEVAASGGGYSGSGRVWRLGLDGPGPDSLGVTLAADSLDCGDSTAVSVRSLLAGVEKPLDDTTRVLVAVLDSTRTRLAWGDTSGVALRIPYGDIAQDSTVWLRTVDCADLDGPLAVGVRVSVDVPWLDEPLAGEAMGVLRPGGGFGAGGLYSVRLLRQNEVPIP
ncbi:MAG: hypothetical protein AAFQ43_13310, partial [Bacteroidota bacterium]